VRGLVIGVVFLLSALVLAQEDVVAVIERAYEKPELKEPSPHAGFQVIQETWRVRTVVSGSWISTQRGQNSFVELRLKDPGGSWIRVRRNSLLRLLKEKELYYAEVTKGYLEVQAAGRFILRSKAGRVEATRGTFYVAHFREDGSVAIKVERGGVLLVTKDGVRFQMKDGAKGALEFDASRGRYVFTVSRKSEVPVMAVGKEETKEVLPGFAADLVGEGLFSVRRIKIEEKAKYPRYRVKFTAGFAAVMRGFYFDDDDTYGYYMGGLDEFDILKAEARVFGTYYNYARFRLALDGSTSKPTNEAWVEFTLTPSLGWGKEHIAIVRFGQVRVPFGYQVSRAREDLALPFYPFLVRYGFCGLQARMPQDYTEPEDAANLDLRFDLGAMMYGHPITGLREAAKFDIRYAIGVFNGTGRNAEEDNHRKLFCGRLEFIFKDRLIIGGSYYDGGTGRHADEYHRRRRGLHLRYQLSWLALTAEYLFVQDDPRVGKDYNDSEGVYAEVDLSFAVFWKRAENLHLIVRWELFHPAPKSMPSLAPSDVPDVSVMAVGFRWDIKKWVALVVAWEKIDQGEERYPSGFKPEEADETFHFFLVINITDLLERISR